MKRIKAEAEFSAEQLNEIRSLAAQTGLCEQTVAILYGRGIDTEDKIDGFLNPSRKRFLNPFLMSGMKEAAELIRRARDEQWTVVVYGDYDADGVCAATIMTRSLADYGVEAYVYVPERSQGYGLSCEAIDFIFEEYCPQLFITVDCGISDAKEVEYVKEQGAEVIVTDHHELPSVLPDCICVNPKIKDDYPYDNLCGAGVAFKVACALNGRDAYSYLDFAAIATVADSVTLIGENRDIVAEGLNLINANPRKNYADFLNKNGEPTTAQTLAFSVAPKINAAGRMGDANAALRLFLESDEKAIYEDVVRLTSYNQERQKCCDELYLSAKQKLREKGADGRVIMLWDDGWNTGFVGIVAARLAEEYCRPTLLFVKNGDVLKGSARSVEGVNIFEALKSCEDLIVEFGGHSQAAGVNVAEENLAALEERLNAYLHAHYPVGAFTPTYYVNGELSAPYSMKFVRELERMEPFGVGNRKPLFTMTVGSCSAHKTKSGSPHLAVRSDWLDMMFFSSARYLDLLRSGMPKRLVFEYNLSTFRRRQYVKGFIRDVVYAADGNAAAEEDIAVNNVLIAALPEVRCETVPIDRAQAQRMLSDGGEYGTVFVASGFDTLKEYDCGETEINLFTPSSLSLADLVLISPQEDCDLSGYERVVFLDRPVRITLPSLAGKKVYVCTETDGGSALRSLDCDRDVLLGIYKAVGASPSSFEGDGIQEVARNADFGLPKAQVAFALKVFEQLNLISFKEGKLTVYRGVKTQLANSALYRLVAQSAQ